MKQQCLGSEKATRKEALVVNNLDNDSNANGNNDLNNNASFLLITQKEKKMENKDLYQNLISLSNLFLAYKKAKKGKSKKPYVLEFIKDLPKNLKDLNLELSSQTYRPKPLTTFIIRDPKTRKISKSDFRDRIIHHALVNILEPIFDKSFIFDSYANRKTKGTLKAIQRFDKFKRKVSKNNTINCYVLKADIRHYFENVDHEILIKIIKRKVKDEKIIWLIKQILNNFNSETIGKGMPLGNLTSQFFANVYLNELDKFIKHKLRIRYYIRYVDDFVIFHKSKDKIERYKSTINKFLNANLNLELHQGKSKVLSLNQGITFLGFRNFYNHKLLKKTNIRKIKSKITLFENQLKQNLINYDKIYSSFESWLAHAMHANTIKLRKSFIEDFENKFPKSVSSIEINRLIKALN